MPRSTAVTIADDVKELLAPAVAAAEGTVERVHGTDRELQELAALLVSVFAREETHTQVSRRMWQRDYTVDVAVRQRSATDEATDGLTAFVETLANVLEDSPLPTVQATLIGIRVAGPDPGELEEAQVFVAVISATYRGGRLRP